MAFMLVPAAHALAANFPLTLESEGSGNGTIECEVEEGPTEPCDPEYPEGTEIEFVADPNTGSEFSEWGGDCIGQGDECELTIEEATLVTAVFELEEVPLEVFAEGPGVGEIECEVEGGPVEACEAEYPFGTEIAFVAEPDSESEFVEWGGDCSGNEECELTMDEEHFVSAVFDLAHFALEIEFEGSGGGTVECEVEGGPVEACEPSYLEGTEVVLIAEPDSESEFVEWEGCDAEPSAEECEVTIDEDREVFVTFDLIPLPEFTLEVEKEGSGSGTVTSSPSGINCGGECEAEYEEGKTVTLTASASLGSEFVEWEGCDAEPSATKCEVTIEEDRVVVAVFELEPPPSEFALTVSLAGTGSGTVTSSPSGINCGIDCSEAFASGTEVTLTATPATGSTFSGWSGACAGTGACKVTMSATRSVTATFTKESPPPPGPGTAVVASTAKVKGGKALLKLTCTGEGACKGSLKLTAKIKSGGKTKNLTIGKASFSLAAGAKKTIKVKLSGPAKKAVAKKPLKAKVKGSGVRSSTVKLKK